MSESLVFLSGKRTPFGANGGALKDFSAADLAVHASRAALAQARVEPALIDHVIFGSLIPASGEALYLPRHVGLRAGVPEAVPALGINRLCGTSFQVIIEAYHQMLAGDTKVALVGGSENMSQSPYVLKGARWGMRMGHSQAIDLLTDTLTDAYAQAPMAITAENLAEKYQLTREECDAFAMRSQTLYKEAAAAGRFADQIAPFPIRDRKGVETPMDRDEHPRPDTTLETLGKLKAVFKKDGVVTAGNASGIVDGAAALVVATEAEAGRRGWTPLARLVSYGISGCDPKIMGIGPVPATKIALKKAGLKLEDMHLIEVNEAFAAQTLSVERELGIPRDRLNVNGGAIAVGHPLAATGARITAQAISELRRRRNRYALVSACIGGGQGIALVIEAL